MVTRSDGVIVVVEVETASGLYREKDRARLEALWAWCQEHKTPFVLAINEKGFPSVWTGPFVTEEFMESVRQHRVRFRTMQTVDTSEAAVPSACELTTCQVSTDSFA
jgi:hypothetical protein